MLLSLCALALFATTSVCVEASFHAPNSIGSPSSQCACDKLLSSRPDLTLTKGSEGYAFENSNFWDKRSDLSPTCIFMPTSADEVAKGVSIFHKCDAQFAVRGGGHMNVPGSNNVNDGVLLALNNLTGLDFSSDTNTINVGSGNTWFDVYSALAPYGRYAIGGRLKTIGVPGLTLIGGVGYFLNKYGFSMDSVLSYEIVLGNGSQITASKTSSPDLFWALKGGGSNYGIVTNFELKTYDVPQVTSTYQIFEESNMRQFITAACDMALSDDGAVGAGAVINMSYNTSTKAVTPQVFGLQEGISMPPSRFENFTAIPAVQRAHNVTEPSTWHAQFDTPFQMFRIEFQHHTIKPDADRLFEIYKVWRAKVEDIIDVEGLLPTFVLNLSPKSAATVAKTNGIGNTFGLDDDESFILFQVATSWSRAEDDLKVTNWSRSLMEGFHQENKKMGLASDFIYMGDAGGNQKVFEHYGHGNMHKMRNIRDVYDADLVFTRLNRGGFKLGH